MTTAITTKVARGDLALFPKVFTSYGQAGRQESLSIELGVVTSVTRDGVVKAAAVPFLASEINPTSRKIGSNTNLAFIGKTLIDADGAMAAYRARVYPGTNQIRPFKTMDEARALLRQHRVAL